MTQKHANFDLSIVVTSHAEGLIAHKTMLSVVKAVARLEEAGIDSEVLISIDNGNDETKGYFERYRAMPGYRVLDVNFRDLSASRNNAIQEATGKYVTFLDADDLISANWFIDGYALATKTDAIIHPEYSITFGDDNLMWRKRNNDNIVRDTLCLIDNNLWDSPCLAKRDIFLAHPYMPNGNGYGYEDKHFNSETLADNIAHLVAPRTILFVRRKLTGSMLMQATSDRSTVAPTKLLDYKRIASLDLTPYLDTSVRQPAPLHRKLVSASKHEAKLIAKKFHNQAKRYDIYLTAIQPLREKRQQRILGSLRDKYPDWMMQAWREIHHIDNQIFPGKELLKHLNWYNAENIQPGLKYTELVQSFSTKPDTLFFVPHIIKGGADMLFINYSAELKRQHVDWNIAMLQTEAKESVWRGKISNDIDFINLFETFQGLDYDTQYRLLATLVTQNNIRRIIIGNSQLAYDFISKYQTLVKRLNIAVYCFAFGEEFDDEGRLWGHIHTGIPRIYPVIHRIITDNQNTVNKLEREYAFDPRRFAVHYQPTAATVKQRIHTEQAPLRILWASRVCKQKRPDILKAVSNKLNSNSFQIDAYGQLEEGITPDYFSDSHVNYKGPFNGSDSLPTDSYDVFLYTSEGDGVPNVLQEMTAAGLPIVASNVGGIKEFVQTGKTGSLVEDHENIDGYVAAIKQLHDPSLRNTLIKGSSELLTTQFSANTWSKCISRDFDK